MKTSLYKWILVSCICMLGTAAVVACSRPIAGAPTELTSTSATLNWNANGEVDIWEVKVVSPDQTFSSSPIISPIDTNYLEHSGLASGKPYRMYVRAICGADTSLWSYPLSFLTHIENTGICQLDIPIRDYGSFVGFTEFPLNVDLPGQFSLGSDIFLEKVELIVAHDHIPDLDIYLANANGNNITLMSDLPLLLASNLGNPLDTNCEETLTFSSSSCLSIEEADPPLVGEFQPELPLDILNDGSDPNGVWSLIIEDDASFDVGSLHFIRLHFSGQSCSFNTFPSVSNVSDSEILLNWNAPQADSIVFLVQDVNSSFSETYVGLMGMTSLDIGNLLPGTDYEISYTLHCGGSEYTGFCTLSASTVCSIIAYEENFDDISVCQSNCIESCYTGEIWYNAGENANWIVNEGGTPSSGTGPESDLSGNGRYIYLEASSNECPGSPKAILQSPCLVVSSDPGPCGISFFAHFFGDDMGSLKVILDNGIEEDTLLQLTNYENDQWEYFSLDLSSWASQLINIRIEGSAENGNRSDMAIDQIMLHHITIDTALIAEYFIDNDLDGFGYGESISLCTSILPEGYSEIDGDCDDANPDIFPGADEIHCNGIDDNCNGPADEYEGFDPLEYQITNLQHPTCAALSNGAITINIEGGHPPYEIIWNDDVTGNSRDSLDEGVYYFHVIDTSSCELFSDFIELDYQHTISLSWSGIVQPSCANKSDGAAGIQTSGGQPPLSYEWNTGDTLIYIDSLAPGMYDVSVTDNQGCRTVSPTLSLSAEGQINIDFITSPESCPGRENGKIFTSIPGQPEDYQFQWSTGDTSTQISNLSSGYYGLTLTDLTNGCIGIFDSIEVPLTAPIDIGISQIDSTTCPGGSDGQIISSITGGTPPYNYLWSSESGQYFQKNLYNVPAGNYLLFVSDSKGCTSTLDSIILGEPPHFNVDEVNMQSPGCKDSTGSIELIVSGGSSPLLFGWNTGILNEGQLFDIPSGTYKATVTDANGCKYVPEFILLEDSIDHLIVSTLVLNEPLCAGDGDGLLSSMVENGNSPYLFNWSAGLEHFSSNSMDSLINLSGGWYDVTVTDANGCVGTSATVQVDEPDPLLLMSSEISLPYCEGDSSGSILLVPMGGTPDYYYFWDNGDTINPLIDIPAGTYTALIKDEYDCQFITSPMQVPDGIEFGVETSFSPASQGMNDGEASIIPYGGTEPYFIQWDVTTGSQTSPIATNLFEGTYYVRVTDSNFCMIDTFVIVPQAISVSNLTNEISVYPNPFSGDRFYISLPDASIISEGYMINPKGKRFYPDYIVKDNVIEMVVIGIPAGVYVVRVIGKDGRSYFGRIVRM